MWKRTAIDEKSDMRQMGWRERAADLKRQNSGEFLLGRSAKILDGEKSRARKVIKKSIFKSAATLLGFVLVAAFILGGGGGEWLHQIGIMAVGFSSPEGGARALSEWLEREPAAFKGSGDKIGSLKGDFDDTTDRAGGEGQNVEIPPKSVVPPAEEGNGGKVTEQQFTSGSDFINGIAIKNNTSRNIDIAKESKIKPNLKIEETDKPQVLIMHTHTTEAYMEYFAGYFNASDPSRTLNNNKNVVMVGEIIASQLEAKGIKVIHDKNVHDHPKYTGAYSRSEETVKKLLAKYPTIKVVLDVHRDATNRSATHKLKPTAMVNGKKAAQIMIVNGVANTDSQPHPNWIENIRMSFQLQSKMHTAHPGLMRPVYIVNSRYNQHLTPGSILLEMGSEANTLEEVAYSGQLLGKILAEVLLTMK